MGDRGGGGRGTGFRVRGVSSRRAFVGGEDDALRPLVLVPERDGLVRLHIGGPGRGDVRFRRRR
jgi:hypothetical protein